MGHGNNSGRAICGIYHFLSEDTVDFKASRKVMARDRPGLFEGRRGMASGKV